MVSNSLYNVLYRCLNIVFPFITSIYIARVLMAESIGKVAAAQNLVSYFTLLAAMGIPTYGIKIVAQYKVKSKESSKAFTELFIINLILSIIFSIAYFIVIITVPHYAGRKMLYCVTGINIIFNVINVDWFYQGIQEYKYIAIRSLVIKVLSVFAIFVFVKNSDDYIVYALISSGALVGNYIFNIIRIRKYVCLLFSDLQFKEHIRHILILSVASIAAEVYVLADTTMLDYMCGATTVGYYNMSMRIIKIVRGVVIAVAAVFLPQFSALFHDNKIEAFYKLINKGLHVIGALSIPIAVGIALTADDVIVLLFGKEFQESILATQILSVSIISVAFSSFIGMQVLVTIGKEKITTLSTMAGAVVNIVLNYFLIKILKHNGAAISSAITELTVTTIQLILARRFIPFQFKYKKILVSMGIMILVVLIIKTCVDQIVIRLILEILFGVVSYVGVMLVTKDEFAISVIHYINRGEDINV